MKLTQSVAEREEGNSYQQGWKTYGFAAPFSSVEVKKQESVPVVE